LKAFERDAAKHKGGECRLERDIFQMWHVNTHCEVAAAFKKVVRKLQSRVASHGIASIMFAGSQPNVPNKMNDRARTISFQE